MNSKDIPLNAKSCRLGLVRFLFSKQLHYGLLLLLGLDVVLVMAGLQLKIEHEALQAVAIADCFAAAVEPSRVSYVWDEGKEFHEIEDARACIEDHKAHKLAERLELLAIEFDPSNRAEACGGSLRLGEHRYPEHLLA